MGSLSWASWPAKIPPSLPPHSRSLESHQSGKVYPCRDVLFIARLGIGQVRKAREQRFPGPVARHLPQLIVEGAFPCLVPSPVEENDGVAGAHQLLVCFAHGCGVALKSWQGDV